MKKKGSKQPLEEEIDDIGLLVIFSKLQERRAILFCKEDRAILCKECDLPIHKANEHTQIHNRFLLTGVKLSASSSLYPTSSSSTASDANVGTENRSTKSSIKRPEPIHNEALSSPSRAKTKPPTIKISENENSTVSISTSSISEYLMETLPGWRVEDFLDPSSANYNGFCKVCGAAYNKISLCFVWFMIAFIFKSIKFINLLILAYLIIGAVLQWFSSICGSRSWKKY